MTRQPHKFTITMRLKCLSTTKEFKTSRRTSQKSTIKFLSSISWMSHQMFRSRISISTGQRSIRSPRLSKIWSCRIYTIIKSLLNPWICLISPRLRGLLAVKILFMILMADLKYLRGRSSLRWVKATTIWFTIGAFAAELLAVVKGFNKIEWVWLL